MTVKRWLPLDMHLQHAARQHFRRMLSSRIVRSAIAAFLACSVILVLNWKTGAVSTLRSSIHDVVRKPTGEALTESTPHVPGKGRLHLLVPATSSNEDLCKLLVSAQILGYPTPVLINFGDDEEEDPYVQHLAKVEGLLDYLDRLEDSSEYDEDLVLIVDGYDVWFQLRPDVLIKRYYDVIKKADARAIRSYGKEAVEKDDIRHTVLLGPDKVCWPVDFSRPACWAVPGTTLSKFAFGPQTGNGRDDYNDPKWLNSGTVLGPVQDLREFFRATLDLIHEDHVTDSDQYYMAQLFGLQEFARLSHNETAMHELRDTRYSEELSDKEKGLTRTEPSLKSEKKTEFHILIDGESALFQTLAFWRQYLTFTTAIHSWHPHGEKDQQTIFDPYQASIPTDIEASAPPFNLSGDGIARSLSWSHVQLLYNTVSQHFPVLVHFTGEKRFRDVWWQYMWYQPHAEDLRKASARLLDDFISDEAIDGKHWVSYLSEHANEYKEVGISGAESDRRGWLSWKTMCGAHERVLFDARDDSFSHPHGILPEDANGEDGGSANFPIAAAGGDR